MMTSTYFGLGHRLSHMAGSNFPLYERKLQTGGRNYEARITVHHDAGRASFIEFPMRLQLGLGPRKRLLTRGQSKSQENSKNS